MSQYAFGAFVNPLEEEFGWSRAQINLSLSFGASTAVISPFIGGWMDRVGARPVMVVSLAMVAAAFLLRAFMTELWQLYLFSFLAFAGFPGATIATAGRLVGIWFPQTRGRMMGIVTAGNNFGGLTMAPMAAALIVAFGWRWGYGTFGLVMLAVLVIAFVLVRDRPEDVARESKKRFAPQAEGGEAARRAAASGFDVRGALRLPTFYFVTAGLVLGMYTYHIVLTQLYPHLESVGFSEGQASAGMMVVAGTGFASKLVFGRLSEWMTARYATVLSLGIQALGLVMLILVDGSVLAWGAAFLFGAGFGGFGALVPLNMQESFGLRYFGSLLGLVNLVGVIPIVTGPLLAGIIFDNTGSYDLAFAITIGLFAAGALSMLVARRPSALPQGA